MQPANLYNAFGYLGLGAPLTIANREFVLAVKSLAYRITLRDTDFYHLPDLEKVPSRLRWIDWFDHCMP